MAWSFDEINDDVQLADNAVLTFPDGDWSVGGWVKLDDNAGTAFQYFFSWGAFDVNPSFNWFFREAGASEPNKLRVNIRDGDTSLVQFDSSTTPGTSTDWQHLMMIRSGDTFTMYVDGSSVGSEVAAAMNIINVSGASFLGSRAVSPADRFLGGDMAEWAKWDRALSASERAALSNRYSPLLFPDAGQWYCSMVREYQETVEGITVTNNGSTIGDHPPMIYPVQSIVGFRAAAVAPAEIPAARPAWNYRIHA